jgi:pimeloyl-ACP methyl ester carboxylesterase
LKDQTDFRKKMFSKMTKPPKIYLIPGLGGDRRLFTGLKEEGLEFEVLEFIAPKKGESLADYAGRLSEGIDRSAPFIIGGVSLGGIISLEVAHHLQPEKIILISSVKSSREFPFYFRLFRYLPLYRRFSGEFYKKHAPRDSRKGMPQYKYDLLDAMRTDADPVFVKWAVDAVVNWKRREIPENVIHIHGTRDLMFPGWLLGPRHKIPKGRHVMVLSQADEVMALLRELIPISDQTV